MIRLLLGVLALALSAMASGAAHVDQWRADGAAADQDNWLLHGRDYGEQRFSPLDQINAATVGQLGLAWAHDANSNRGLEATPLVIDGVMYVTGTWSVVMALDAVTGRTIWEYDPQVPRELARRLCCDVVNRGVAAWEGRIFVGTLDGRLIALNAETGKPEWSAQTTPAGEPYSITGAPRVVKGKVIIGNGGAEFGVRGYITAYDAATGRELWRFHTVPGNPASGYENSAMERAAHTWNGEWWQLGGGGTVWDSMSYDPQLDLLYVGVGNGSPWNRRLRSPGGGDNLYLSSILALRPDTGEYVWHYQVVPGESWDYTATQHMILADLEIDGRPRKVLMQAPKSGFFMVIDRESGRLISAKPFVPVTWATHYDLATGRPVEAPGQDYPDGRVFVKPSSGGAHNWQPMAFHPGTGLVYLPAMDAAFGYANPASNRIERNLRNTGVDRTQEQRGDELFHRVLQKHLSDGFLLAWNPREQREVWRAPRRLGWNGGVLATAGNLVFQGTGDGWFEALRADTGERVWRYAAGSGVIAAPITFRVNGAQYVTILAGWGGAYGLMTGIKPDTPPVSRILTFRIGAAERLPTPPAEAEIPPAPPQLTTDPAVLDRGAALYASYCAFCHGVGVVSGGTVPDLRRLPRVFYDGFDAVVRGGLMEKAGMPRFDDALAAEQVEAIRAYVVSKAHQDQELRAMPAWQRKLLEAWYEMKSWFIARFMAASSHSA